MYNVSVLYKPKHLNVFSKSWNSPHQIHHFYPCQKAGETCKVIIPPLKTCHIICRANVQIFFIENNKNQNNDEQVSVRIYFLPIVPSRYPHFHKLSKYIETEKGFQQTVCGVDNINLHLDIV